MRPGIPGKALERRWLPSADGVYPLPHCRSGHQLAQTVTIFTYTRPWHLKGSVLVACGSVLIWSWWNYSLGFWPVGLSPEPCSLLRGFDDMWCDKRGILSITWKLLEESKICRSNMCWESWIVPRFGPILPQNLVPGFSHSPFAFQSNETHLCFWFCFVLFCFAASQ